MHVLILSRSRTDRIRAANSEAEPPSAPPVTPLSIDSRAWPFSAPDTFDLEPAEVVRIDDIDLAFPNHQVGGTRLVLTQSTYSLQKLLDRLSPDGRIIATADPERLAKTAPEAFQRRGAWRLFTPVHAPDQLSADQPGAGAGPAERAARATTSSALQDTLARAYAVDSADERVAICERAAEEAPASAVAALALASARREVHDMEGAREALDRALRLAPEWEAAHYEDGKFWLGLDDMERARDAFQRAADLMPSFSAACSNLGATLGELDQPEAALAAFVQAAEHDPESFTILNNIGVVNRELGRLEESETALARVTSLAPGFVFGHYNLGHTRFLKGDYAGALSAYEEGQRRDPQKNIRQACRLALVRFAIGDIAGANRDLWQSVDVAPPNERHDLLVEAYEITGAVLGTGPGSTVQQDFAARIARAIHAERP